MLAHGASGSLLITLTTHPRCLGNLVAQSRTTHLRPCPDLRRNAMPGDLMAPRLHLLSLQNGVAAMAWGCSGYRLVLAEAGMAAQVLELSLAKSPRGSHRILHPSVSQAASGRPAPSEIHILQVSTPAQVSKSTPHSPKGRSTHLLNAEETGLRGLL